MIEFEKVKENLQEHRKEISAKLTDFAEVDTLLFWSRNGELAELQKEKWLPVLLWMGEQFSMKIEKTESFLPPEGNKKNRISFNYLLDKMSLNKLAVFYLASMRMKSPLLALALVNGKITSDEAYELAYLEEIYQSEKWGKDEEAESRRNQIKEELKEIAGYLEK